jgi:uncharacterized protein with GYD domain
VANYVILVNWTDQGIRNFKDTVDRAGAVADLMEKLGGRMKDLYWTLGAYDVVALMEAPDDETATSIALAISAQGNVRTSTLRAFTRDEMGAIVEKAG